MFREFSAKALFEQVQTHRFAYFDEVFDRPVFPRETALEELKHFEEPLPERSCAATEVFELLHRYGAPATIAQLGGQYFGFVSGSAVPAGLAAKRLASF
jgi:hypothetical protein